MSSSVTLANEKLLDSLFLMRISSVELIDEKSGLSSGFSAQQASINFTSHGTIKGAFELGDNGDDSGDDAGVVGDDAGSVADDADVDDAGGGADADDGAIGDDGDGAVGDECIIVFKEVFGLSLWYATLDATLKGGIPPNGIFSETTSHNIIP